MTHRLCRFCRQNRFLRKRYSEPSLCDLEFTNVSAADLNLASEKEQEEAKTAEKHKDLLEALAKALDGKATSVTTSASLGRLRLG